MRRAITAIATLALAVGTGACGDDDDATTTAESGGSAPDCVESFTSSAPDTFAQLAGLSHDPKEQVTVGTYSGEEFSAETYDNGTTGDGTEVTVAPGDCVITEVSSLGVLYLFVQADDGEWHRLLESDPAVPLTDDPASQLDGAEEVEIEEIGA
jgi:hypothetical protein